MIIVTVQLHIIVVLSGSERDEKSDIIVVILCHCCRTSELVTAVAGVLEKEPCRASFRQLLISRLPDLLSAFAEEVKGIRADFKVSANTWLQ